MSSRARKRVSSNTNPVKETVQSTGYPPLKGDSATAVFTFCTGIAFLFLLTSAIARFYHPDISPMLREAIEIVMPSTQAFLAPEPVERLKFLSGLFLTPPFLLVCFLSLRAVYNRLSEELRSSYNQAASTLLILGGLGFPVLAFLSLQNSIGGFLYIRSGVLISNTYFYTLLIFPCFVLLAVYIKKPWITWLSKVGICIASIFISVIAFGFILFTQDSIAPYSFHFNPVIYPMAQVMAGKTLLVDCASLYGLYPHILEPIFRVFPLSVYSFSFVMACLVLLSLIALWCFFRCVIKNDLIFFVGFVAAVFYSYEGPKAMLSAARPDPYFQYVPLRTLFPCLLLALSALYLRGIGKRWIYYATFLISGVAILWNPDSGVVVFGAWCLLLVYTELFRNSFKASVKPILFHILIAASTLALVFGGYTLFVVLRSGSLPDWEMSAQYYKLFYHFGYYMLPMPKLPHLWGFIILIGTVGLVLSIYGLSVKRDAHFFETLFLLTILQAGLFAYYQGRSHDYNLFGSLYVFIAVITLFTDYISGRVLRGERRSLYFLPFAALFFYFLASSIPSLWLRARQLTEWAKEGARVNSMPQQGTLSRNSAFIRSHTDPGEKIFILLPGDKDGIYHAETSTACALDLPSSGDRFFKEDFEKIMNFLLRENTSTKLFTNPALISDPTGFLNSFYREIATDPQTGLTLFILVNAPRQ